MTRRFEHFDPHVAELERIAVPHRHERVLRLRRAAESNRRAGAIAQLEVPGDEVGVEVREKDVADGELVLAGVGEIAIDITLRIDDDGAASDFVADQIGRMRQATEIELLQQHAAIIAAWRE